MKKTIIFSILFALMSIGAIAQTNLFKGIKSGMSPNEYNSYCSSNSDFDLKENYALTVIENRTYILIPTYNEKNQLNSLNFYSVDEFEWMYYDPNVKEIAIELFGLLEVKYGEPAYDVWKDWSDIPKGKFSTVCAFKKNNITAIIAIYESKDKYSIGLTIIDAKYNEETPKTSGGF